MVETTAPEATAGNGTDGAKNHFAKAVEEALAGAKALGTEAQNRAGEYCDKLSEKTEGLTGDAKVRSEEYKEKALGIAGDGKAKASSALSNLSRLITDNAGTLDETVGVKFGDYARSAANAVQDTAVRLDEKSIDELGSETKEYLRSNPVVALGLAAAAGYLIGRVLK